MTNFRSFAPALAIASFVGYSVIVTATSGSLSALASPMLIAAIALAVWHDRTNDRTDKIDAATI